MSLAADLARAFDPVSLADQVGMIPDDWQAGLLRSVAPRVVVNASGQAGKSQTAALLTVHVAVYEAAEDGPFNVWVQAFVTSPAGLIAVAQSVDCVSTADPRAFDLTSFMLDVAGPYSLASAIAYTTTVPGVTEAAPDFC